MEIRETITHKGEEFDVIYRESDPLSYMPENTVLQGVHAYCFFGDRLVIVYDASKDIWSLPGGRIEPGETYQEAIVREMKEESNMKVLQQRLIGYRETHDGSKVLRQTRSVCIVEPFGDFVADPGQDITEIKLVDPEEFKQYVKWGAIGERMLARAIEIKQEIDLQENS